MLGDGNNPMCVYDNQELVSGLQRARISKTGYLLITQNYGSTEYVCCSSIVNDPSSNYVSWIRKDCYDVCTLSIPDRTINSQRAQG